jgi:hypothetical protein
MASCVLNFVGVTMVFGDFGGWELSPIIIAVLAHGGVSATAAVYTELAMADTPRDTVTYFLEAYQLYVVSIPVYIVGWVFLSTNSDAVLLPPRDITIAMVLATSAMGISIGSIFKFFGATERSFVQSAVIVSTVAISHTVVDRDEELTGDFVFGCVLIVLSSYTFIGKTHVRSVLKIMCCWVATWLLTNPKVSGTLR